MKRLSFIIIGIVIVILGIFFIGTGAIIPTTNAATATSAVTVTVPEYIAIEGLDAMSMTLTFIGAPAVGSGTVFDTFTVQTNVNTVISSSVATQPIAGSSYLSSSLDRSASTPGPTAVTLTATMTFS